MKVQIVLTTLLAALIAISLFACSSDIIEEEMVEETPLPELVEPEPPHWADGIIEIEVGRFKTGAEMLTIFEIPNNNLSASRDIRARLAKPNFPMSRQRKTIKVTVVTLQEAGFTKPTTIEEIRKRFKQLGYRPLTLEEAVEIRLQFLDQPDRPTEYQVQEPGYVPPPPKLDRSPGSKMDAFYTLLEKGNEEILKTISVFENGRHSYWGDRYGQGLIINTSTLNTFDPLAPEYSFKETPYGGFVGARFACIIEE